MTKKHVSLLVVFVLLFTTLFTGMVFAADETEWVVADDITITAKAHVQSLGDMEPVTGKGQVAFGTEGKAKRLEKFEITLEGAPADMELVGMAHVQSYGDMPKTGFQTGAIGTSGEAKRIEGVAFKLVKKGTDTLYPGYKIAYAVHMQSFGWGISDKVNEVVGKNFDGAEDFATNGEFAGTRGLAKRVEAVSLIIYKEAKLAVKEVSATNLKEIKVTFNNPVDKETVIDDNFKVANVATTATLTEDPRVVLLTVNGDDNGLTNQAEYTLTVDNVKAVSGTKIEKTELKFKAFDRELPEVTGITVTGPNAFDINFTEPIKQGGVVEVKSGNSVIGVNPTFKCGTSKISVSLYSNLVDGTEYTVNIKEFEDYAGYKNVVTSETLTYKKDNNAPVATIEKAEQNYLVVKFDKPVTGVTKDHFYHTFTAWVADGVYTDSAMTSSVSASASVQKVYVKFSTYPIPAGNASLVIRAKANDVEIKDNWGNKFAGATLGFSVTADLTPPSVSEITVNTETSLKVKFDKTVTFTKDNVEILDDQGKAIDGVNISVTPTTAGKEFTVNFGKNLAGKTIIVNIKNVEDTTLAANKLPLYSTVVKVTDKTPASVKQVTYKDSEKALYVFFDEAVDSSALVAGNYYLLRSNVYTKLTKAPSFFNGNKIVKLPLTDDEYYSFKGTAETGLASIFVNNIKDLEGNVLAGQVISSIVAYNDDANKPTATAKATDTKTIVVTFDQYLTRVDSAAFKIKVGSADAAKPAAMALSTDENGNTVVTLTSTTAFDYTAANVTLDIAVDGTNVRVYNVFGVDTTEYTGMTVADKIAPAIAKYPDGTNKDKYIIERTGETTIEITYTEKIKASTLSTLTYTVSEATVTGVAIKSPDTNGNGAVVVLTIAPGAGLQATEAPTVTQNYNISDVAGNVFKADGALTSIVVTP